MLCMEIIRTCSHEAVAEAALRSLGGAMHRRVVLLAGAHDLSPGAYAAALVAQFAGEAGQEEWRALDKAILRRDMPVLAGLQFILESMIDGDVQARNRATRTSAIDGQTHFAA